MDFMKNVLLGNKRKNKRKSVEDIVSSLMTMCSDLELLESEKDGQIMRLNIEKDEINIEISNAEKERSRGLIIAENISKLIDIPEKVQEDKEDQGE